MGIYVIFCVLLLGPMHSIFLFIYFLFCFGDILKFQSKKKIAPEETIFLFLIKLVLRNSICELAFQHVLPSTKIFLFIPKFNK